MISGWEPTGRSTGQLSGITVGDYVMLRNPLKGKIRMFPGVVMAIYECRVPEAQAKKAPIELNLINWRRWMFFVDWDLPKDATPQERRAYTAKIRTYVQFKDIKRVDPPLGATIDELDLALEEEWEEEY